MITYPTRAEAFELLKNIIRTKIYAMPLPLKQLYILLKYSMSRIKKNGVL